MAGHHLFLGPAIEPQSQSLSKAPLPLSFYASARNVPFEHLTPTQIELFSRLRNSTMLVSSLSSRASSSPLPTSSSISTSTSTVLAASLEKNEQYVLKARICEELSFQQRQADSEKRLAWLIATVLYATTVLSCEMQCRSLGEQEKVVEGLVANLRVTLATEMEWCDIRHGVGGSAVEMDMYAPSVLLWILFVGGVSTDSFGQEEQRRWFGSALRELCAALGLDEWVDVRRSMKELPIPASEEGPGGKWWGWWGRSVKEFRR